MATDATQQKADEKLAHEQREADRKRREAEADSNSFDIKKLFGGMSGGAGGFDLFAMLGKFFQAIFGGGGLGGLFGSMKSSLSGGFDDFSDGVSGRGDTPLAPKGAKPPERSIGAKFGTGIRTGLDGILDLIGKHESKGDYNAAFGGRRIDATNMTINEVLEWQSHQKFSALGKYQIIRTTLAGLKNEMGLSGNEKFDEKMQDSMALKLLERRGIDKFMAGQMTTGQIRNSIAKEWASFENTAGVTQYQDGVNKAAIGSGKHLETLLAQAKDQKLAARISAVDTKVVASNEPTFTKPAKVASAAPEMAKVASVKKDASNEDAYNRKTVSVGNGATMFVAHYDEDAKATKVASAIAPVAQRSIDSVNGKPVFNGNYDGSKATQIAEATPAQKNERDINAPAPRA